MIRKSLVVAVYLFIVATPGCRHRNAASTNVETAPIVTIDEFRDAAKDHETIWTAGSKDGFHYFRLRHGYYRVSASEVEVPQLDRIIKAGRADPTAIARPELVRSRLDPNKNLVVEVDNEPEPVSGK